MGEHGIVWRNGHNRGQQARHGQDGQLRGDRARKIGVGLRREGRLKLGECLWGNISLPRLLLSAKNVTGTTDGNRCRKSYLVVYLLG